MVSLNIRATSASVPRRPPSLGWISLVLSQEVPAGKNSRRHVIKSCLTNRSASQYVRKLALESARQKHTMIQHLTDSVPKESYYLQSYHLALPCPILLVNISLMIDSFESYHSCISGSSSSMLSGPIFVQTLDNISYYPS